MMKLNLFALVALTLLCPLDFRSVPAMPILDFMRLNDDDGSTYIAMLVQGAAKMLRTQGKPEQARQLIALFKDPSKNGGVHQTVLNLRGLNEMNNRNATNPNNRIPAYDIEDGLSATMADHDIKVPASYLRSLGNGFQPIGPLRSRTPVQATH